MAAGDGFGKAAAASDPYLLLGAPFDDDGGNAAGAAYVFFREGAGWTQQAKLTAGDPAANDEFGRSVAVSGDYAVVGARSNDEAGQDAGAVYVFLRDGASWAQQAKLAAPDAAAGDGFGTGVSISGDRIAVGAPGRDYQSPQLVPDAGAVYVFHREGASWAWEATLIASAPGPADALGSSVSIGGDSVLAGAPGDDHDGGAGSGAAYAFRRDGADWSQEAKIVPQADPEALFFGTSLSLSGDYAAIGAFLTESGTGNLAPAIVVYERLGVSWGLRAREELSRAGAEAQIHVSVAIDGTTALAGNPFDRLQGNPAGSVLVLGRTGLTWEISAKLTAGDIASGDEFGSSVAISDGYAVVGAPGDDDGGSGSGSAYLLWASPLPDCNDNQEADFCDVWTGSSTDVDGNGVPDECAGACADDSQCDDGVFCNGPESCDQSGACQPGTAACSAGQHCDEADRECDECSQDSDCDDGAFCTGVETCDASGTCQPGTPPCLAGQFCDEVNQECDECNQDSQCDDGDFCNGPEFCDQTGRCQPGTSPCSTGEFCDQTNRECDQCQQGGDCDDGQFCDGVETCAPDGSCQDGTPPCAAGQVCDETNDECDECARDSDCFDGDACTGDKCVAGECVYPRLDICDDPDQDGVDTAQDACPDTPPVVWVDANGCACSQLDEDDDGVDDCIDLCPQTQAGQNVGPNGCVAEAPPGHPLPPGGDPGHDGVEGDPSGEVDDPADNDGHNGAGSAGSAEGNLEAGQVGGPLPDDQIPAGAAAPTDQGADRGGGAGRTDRRGGACGALGMLSFAATLAGLVLLRGRRNCGQFRDSRKATDC